MKQQSITTLPPSPEAERRSRMIKYTIAMSIRVACIFCMLFAQGWWLVVFAAGAVFLPYVAVVLANVSGPTRNQTVLRPGGIVPVGDTWVESDAPDDDAPAASDSAASPSADAPEPSAPRASDEADPPTRGDERGVDRARAAHPQHRSRALTSIAVERFLLVPSRS